MSSRRLWLERLQVSPQSQRTILETAADWRCDAVNARTPAARVSAHLRGVASMIRLLPAIVADSALPAFQLPWLCHLVVWSAIAGIVAPRVSVSPIWFACFAVPMSVLLGPSSRRSPMIGFAVLQTMAFALASQTIANATPGALIRVCVCAILASAVADRVRIDGNRELQTMALFVALFVAWAAAIVLVTTMRKNGISPRVVDIVFSVYVAVVLAGIWRWLVFHHESTGWSLYLQVYREQRASVSAGRSA